MLVVPQIVSDTIETVINVIIENMQEMGLACNNIFFEDFNNEGHNGFFYNVSVTLINKTDAKNPIKQEHCWRHTLKKLAPHGLNAEDDFKIKIYLYVYSIATMY